MSVRSPRALHQLVIFAAVAGACSLQIPDEKDVFSDVALVGGKSSGGVAGRAGALSLGGSVSGGSQSIGSTSGASGTGSGGATAALGGSAGASGAIGAGGPSGASGGDVAGGNAGASNAGSSGTADSSGGATAAGGSSSSAGNGATSGTASSGGAVAGTGGGDTAGTAGAGGSVSTGGQHTGGQGTGGAIDPFSLGLVAHYKFDEPSGTVAENSIDSSKPGTLMGMATRVAGKYGKAVRVRNDKVTTDFVALADGLLSGLSATTISMWVYDLSTTRLGTRAFDFGTGSGANIFLSPSALDAATSTIGAQIAGANSGLTFVNIWSAGNYADSTWHLFTVTWDASAIQLYVDGTLAASKASPSTLPSAVTATPNWLGKYVSDPTAMYANFDDLRIYNKVLTPELILSLYQVL